MVTKGDKPQEDTRVLVPMHIKDALVKYAYDERKRMENPVVREMITWRSLVNAILINEMEKRGYYKRKL